MDDPRQRRIEKLEKILDVAKTMATQHDLAALLELVIGHARAVAGAERATIFVLDKAAGELWSKVAHGSREIRFPATKGIAGSVVASRVLVNIPDAYADPRFNPEVDKATGFVTRTLLTVPMLSTKSDVVGVLQVLNKRAGGAGSEAAAFDHEDEEMLLALGGQAASAIENALLYEAINGLFEGFIKASVVAIEARDPTTSGHSERVALLTSGLAEAVDRLDSGPLAAVRFDSDQMRVIRYASLLHDFGKVGVRERVLVKAEKLYPEELALLLARFDFIKRTAEKEAAERKLAVLASTGARDRDVLFSGIDAELARVLAETEEARRAVLACNTPAVTASNGFVRLEEIAARTFASFDGAKPTLTPSEIASLSLSRGGLTEQDRREIESHVTHTYRFLAAIPWTEELRRIPEIASGHHEKLDGRGYPSGLSAERIPVETRMMTISDIYDALTAEDRPYKKALSAQRALDVLAAESESGAVDPELFQVFVEARVYRKTAGR